MKSGISWTLSSRPAAIRSWVTVWATEIVTPSDADFGEDELDEPVAEARALRSGERAAAPRPAVTRPGSERIRRIALPQDAYGVRNSPGTGGDSRGRAMTIRAMRAQGARSNNPGTPVDRDSLRKGRTRDPLARPASAMRGV